MRRSEYSNIDQPRELISKVTDEQKLDMLPQTMSELEGKLIRNCVAVESLCLLKIVIQTT